MATKEQYEAALVKAETLGLTSLNRDQLELVAKLAKQAGAQGNRARRVMERK